MRLIIFDCARLECSRAGDGKPLIKTPGPQPGVIPSRRRLLKVDDSAYPLSRKGRRIASFRNRERPKLLGLAFMQMRVSTRVEGVNRSDEMPAVIECCCVRADSTAVRAEILRAWKLQSNFRRVRELYV